jgi:adenylate cyclase
LRDVTQLYCITSPDRLSARNSTDCGIVSPKSAKAHAAKALIFLMTGVAAGFVARLICRQVVNSFRSVEERNRIVGIFGQHVSPEVVDALLTQELELGGDVRHVCMMFLDIRDFTTYSETKGPEEVVQYLNSLFEFMVDIVNRHHGIVNKFLGDGFMAVFGAPIAGGEATSRTGWRRPWRSSLGSRS